MAISIFTWLEIHALWYVMCKPFVEPSRREQSRYSPLLTNITRERKERSGPMIYGCDDASRPGMINLCWEHFQEYKFNLWTPSPQTQNTHVLSAHVCSHFLGLRGERSYLGTFCMWWPSVGVLVFCLWICGPLVGHPSKPFHLFHF